MFFVSIKSYELWELPTNPRRRTVKGANSQVVR